MDYYFNVYLDVPFAKNYYAKIHNARFDFESKMWYYKFRTDIFNIDESGHDQFMETITRDRNLFKLLSKFHCDSVEIVSCTNHIGDGPDRKERRMYKHCSIIYGNETLIGQIKDIYKKREQEREALAEERLRKRKLKKST
jgi:hypothetical protein